MGHPPAVSILSILESMPIEQIDDETLILVDHGQEAIFQVRQGPQPTHRAPAVENLPNPRQRPAPDTRRPSA